MTSLFFFPIVNIFFLFPSSIYFFDFHLSREKSCDVASRAEVPIETRGGGEQLATSTRLRAVIERAVSVSLCMPPSLSVSRSIALPLAAALGIAREDSPSSSFYLPNEPPTCHSSIYPSEYRALATLAVYARCVVFFFLLICTRIYARQP